MKRLMIIGASVLQLPAIHRAKELGYYVGVVDYNPNAIGVPFADEYFNVSTIDVEGVVEAAKEFRPDGIMTLATDMPMRSIAAACEKLGLPGISPDTAIKSTDKGEMIKAFDENDVEHPWYFVLSEPNDLETVIDKITFPCVSKPTDNSGSRGVILIHNRDELEKAIDYSSQNGRSGGVIVEQYLQGKEVSVEVVVTDGNAYILNVTDKLTTGTPHFVEMGHTQPSQLKKNDLEKIHDLACRAVKAVGIKNGPAHVEIMLTETGPKMIELGARMGGDFIATHLVYLSTGIDMIEATIRISCGETPDIERKFNKGCAIRYFNTSCGVIDTIDGVEEAKQIPGVKEVMFTKQIGDTIGEIGSSMDRVGFVIAQGNTAEDAVRICESACDKINIVIK